MQAVCSPACAMKYNRQRNEAKALAAKRARKRAGRERLEWLKTPSEVMKEAQREFNRWVRERDHGRPCISCGAKSLREPLTGGAWDCGHYRSTGAAPELRFTEINAHRQCKRCNRDLAGNAVAYRRGLIERIGEERVAWIEGDHQPARWRKADFQKIRDHYRKEANRLARERRKGEGQ